MYSKDINFGFNVLWAHAHEYFHNIIVMTERQIKIERIECNIN